MGGYELTSRIKSQSIRGGRGYWQELIESILWAHHKFKIMPHIQPQGRAVGFIHYTLGGVGCTWAFFISRTNSLLLTDYQAIITVYLT